MTSSSIETRPSFATERLRAEPVELRHAEVMIGVLNDPEIYRFLSDDPPTLTQLQCQYRFLMGGKSPDGLEHWLTWILIPHEQPAEPAGFVQATIREPESAHVAYVLSRKHWGMRYGSEALLALLDVVFTRYDVERAVAEMDTRNDASIALVRSLGFRHLCTLNDVTELKGTMSHEHVYELQRSDWSRLKG